MTRLDTPRGYRVLLVEDEYFIAMELADLFRRRGAEVLGPVPTVDQALDLIAATSRLDGAVLDINLHGEMAYDVADVLEARKVPFVFATGYDREVLPPRFAGARVCNKPVVAEQVVRALLG
ncbi:response regulator [Methylobacterium frigidaeris]|uniref:Response regulatory domain-containing protein n=1 Tax=Methylobacterium frigidaeris TaxID=2038277 RepID=A0AA37M5A5_9HYPH|nr:response regulator [Methylobacterium frigidaeris]GJD63115.1 hypothetical protein MPEAHAMD_3277 [Methylobacterium frigidaeris]